MNPPIELTGITPSAVLGRTSDGFSVRIDWTADGYGLVPLEVHGPGFVTDRRCQTRDDALRQARDIITGRRRLAVVRMHAA